MTALTMPQTVRTSAAERANHWITANYEELRSRAEACFARLKPEAREEAVSEVLAIVTASAHRAAARGALSNLTPHWCVVFGVRHVRIGRRLAGTSSRDVLSEAAKQKHGLRVVSLDDIVDDGCQLRRLREALVDRDAESAGEVVRRRHDYPFMLRAVSDKARTVFVFLAEHQGEGRQLDLAAQLMVTPGRITQLKSELANILATHGYHGPLFARPAVH